MILSGCIVTKKLITLCFIFRPVSRLVRVCGEVQAGPTEQEEISFLCTVCAQLKKEPHLVHFFLRNNQETAKQSNEMSNKVSK